MKQKLLLIGGPTAVGKSEFALKLSKKLKMEIISADSVQVYKELNVGTSKPSQEEKELCVHHLIDEVSFKEKFNAFDFVNLSKKYIEEIANRGNLPVIVGGTGLYMESLLFAYSFKKEKENNESVYDYKLYILNQDRQKLYDKINKRVDIMLENGLLDEVKRLMDMGVSTDNQCFQAIGYKELVEYLNGNISYEEAVEKIKQGTRNYAKRQLTWFRHMNGTWIDVDENLDEEIDNIVNIYYNYKK